MFQSNYSAIEQSVKEAIAGFSRGQVSVHEIVVQMKGESAMQVCWLR